jgi:16S rRNA processing protein RimM
VVQVADWLHAGRVGRPHGLDGSFHVTRGRWALLAPGATLRVGEIDLVVERRAGTEDRPILRFAGAAAREDAEALRGTDLRAERATAPALPEGEYWAEELEGCTVADGATDVGVVVGLVELPSCEALQVRRPAGDELLVPMVQAAVRSIDTAGRRVDIDLAFLGETA